jgi:hypothetical protein
MLDDDANAQALFESPERSLRHPGLGQRAGAPHR